MDGIVQYFKMNHTLKCLDLLFKISNLGSQATVIVLIIHVITTLDLNIMPRLVDE